MLITPLFLYGQDFINTNRTAYISLEKASASESFSFAILGDRTTGKDEGLLVLRQAVIDINMLGPDLVMNVGDMIQGYNGHDAWMKQMRVYKEIMSGLQMPWLPTAGNHDVYYRGENKPKGEHESDYENNFGPLWYSFEYKKCCFIVLFTDEGNPETGEKKFDSPECQIMSEAQTEFLQSSLQKAKDAKHVFLFMHQPRWLGGNYGKDWDRVHEILKEAGNVSACFAGHTHSMHYSERDGIAYYILPVTGGSQADRDMNIMPGNGNFFYNVCVRGDDYHVSTFPVGAVINPQKMNIPLILLEDHRWEVVTEEIRTLTFPINIPGSNEKGGTLKIILTGCFDNSGDNGTDFGLIDNNGESVYNGFYDKDDVYEITYPVAAGESYKFIISDPDTVLTGDAPGNGGNLTIEFINND